MARVGCLQDTYSVVEGNTLQLSVGVIEGGLGLELNAIIQIMSGTAQGISSGVARIPDNLR